jgi:pyrimidine operon attenuation protein/uracil phosphoribosyltransferase
VPKRNKNRHNHRMGSLVLDAADMRRTLGRMAHEILEAHAGGEDLVVVGIMRRGWPIAKRLAFVMTQIEGVTIPCGRIDISNYRDDRPPAVTDESEIPFQVSGKKVILVDEVVFTGRTVRSALNALMEHGRPASVELAVLIDRGHRELPIKADFVGKNVPTSARERVNVQFKEDGGPDIVTMEKV